VEARSRGSKSKCALKRTFSSLSETFSIHPCCNFSLRIYLPLEPVDLVPIVALSFFIPAIILFVKLELVSCFMNSSAQYIQYDLLPAILHQLINGKLGEASLPTAVL